MDQPEKLSGLPEQDFSDGGWLYAAGIAAEQLLYPEEVTPDRPSQYKPMHSALLQLYWAGRCIGTALYSLRPHGVSYSEKAAGQWVPLHRTFRWHAFSPFHCVCTS
jgi:hypothetical protein